MKHTLTYIFSTLLFVFLFNASTSSTAKPGKWSWGRGANSVSTDSWPVAVDKAGNSYGAGYVFAPMTFGSVSAPPYTGFQQSYWVKYDPSGTALWAGGTTSGNPYIFNIATDPSDNLIVFGSFSEPTMSLGGITLTNPTGRTQYYLAKINPAGAVVWAINDGNINPSYMYTFSTFIMSTGSVATDAAGNIYITSAFNSPTMKIGTTTLTNTDPSGLTYDAFVAKYTPTGTPVWASSMGGKDNDYSFSVTAASTGDVYIAGDFESDTINVSPSRLINNYPYPMAYVARFSGSGAPIWAQEGNGRLGSFAIGLASDNFGNVYMTGGFCDTTITFGSTTITRYYASASPQLAGYIVQFSPSNTITWKNTMGAATQPAFGFCIALASCGQIWVSGNYSGDMVLEPGDTLRSVPGTDPVFIAGYDLSGGVIDYAGLGGGGDDQNGIACDASGNIFMCSDFLTTELVIGPDTVKGTTSELFYMAKFEPPTNDTNYRRYDTTACVPSASFTVYAPLGYTYQWDNGTTSRGRTVTSNGNYFVYCTGCNGNVLIDTFNVTLNISTDVTKRRIDTNVCSPAGAMTFTSHSLPDSYLWSTGSTDSSITVSTPGVYFVINYTYSPCRFIIDTFHYTITTSDTTYHIHTDSVCRSTDPLIITATTGDTTWLWNTGTIDSFLSLNIKTAGIQNYYVHGSLGCSTTIDTFHIVVKPTLDVALSNDTAFCIGNSYLLRTVQPIGSTYLWSSGATDDTMRVSTTGKYWLRVTNPNGCTIADTINIIVKPLPVVDLGPDYFTCDGTPDTLMSSIAYIAPTYKWIDASTGPALIVKTTGTYFLEVTDNGCKGYDTMNTIILYDTLNFYNHDTAICRGALVPVFVTGDPMQTYQWLPTAGIAVSTINSPVIRPDTSATYVLTTSMTLCPDRIDSIHIDVQPNPVVRIGDNRMVCEFDTLHIISSVTPKWYQHYIYSWSPATFLDNTTEAAVTFKAGLYTVLKLYVSTPAGCAGRDSTEIHVHPGNFAKYDTTFNICPHDSVQFRPKGGIAYEWHPGIYLSDSMGLTPWVKAITSQQYIVYATSKDGCKDTLTVRVNVRPAGTLYVTDKDVTLYPGESYQISPQTNCTYFSWFPTVGLSNPYISNPLAKPEANTKYIITAATEFGCKVIDSIRFRVDAGTLLELPNAFTPGSTGNKKFTIIKRGIAELKYFRIFNRWGNKVFETTNIEDGWDGTYNGVPQPFGVFVYQVGAVTSKGEEFEKHGNVTLIR